MKLRNNLLDESTLNATRVLVAPNNEILPTNRKNDFIKLIFDPQKITLVIRFKKFVVKWDKLERLPRSRLGQIRFATCMSDITNLCDEVDVENNEIYFNRSSRSFENIIDYYYCQKLHLDTTNTCIISLSEDLKYWGIDTCDFDPCCSFKFHQMKEDAMTHISTMQQIETRCSIAVVTNRENIHKYCCQKIRKKMWDIMEFPETSIYAKVSCVLLCIHLTLYFMLPNKMIFFIFFY